MICIHEQKKDESVMHSMLKSWLMQLDAHVSRIQDAFALLYRLLRNAFIYYFHLNQLKIEFLFMFMNRS